MDIKKIIGLPKSLFYNLCLFGPGGVKLPIIFSHNTRIYGIRRNAIEIKSKGARIFIGFDGTKGLEPARHTNLVIGCQGRIVFNGLAFVAAGTTIRVDGGLCEFGDGFSCNTNCFISCTKGVTFGKGCLLGWNVNVRDSDGHTIIRTGIRKPDLKPVSIGDGVWIAANSDILKGVTIGAGSVIGYRSCVTKSISQEHCLIAGYPAKIIQEGISWER